MKNYAEAFNELIQGLKNDPAIAVVSSYIYPPATEAEILEAEEIMNCKLDDCLRAFYQSCNGVQLRWIYRDSEDFNAGEFGTYSEGIVAFDDIKEDDRRLDGCINILSISDVAARTYCLLTPHEAFSESITIHGITYHPNEFMSRAFVWDAFDEHRNIILLPVDHAIRLVCILNSDGIVHHSKKTTVQEYLDFLLNTSGSIIDRISTFKLRRSLLDSPNEFDHLS